MRNMKLLKHMPLVVLLTLFLTGSVLWLLFVHEQQSHLDEVFQYQTERLGDELVRVTLLGQLPPTLPADIVGFGLYTRTGEALVQYGEAPAELVLPPMNGGAGRDGRVFRQAGLGVLDFLKRLDRPGPMMVTDDEGEADHQPRRLGGAALFLRLKEDSLLSQGVAWTAAAVLGPLVWAAFLVFIGWLWNRSRQYQAAISNNRELLQFAEAARTLSHEIKNPLAAILLQTALLKRSAGAEPPQELILIEEETQRINHLVSRVREFLKDPSGQPVVVDLGEALASLLERFAEPIRWNREPGQSWRVSFDPHRLRSVLENLLKNAVESGPDARPEVRLSHPKAGWVRFEVLDSGAGFTGASLKEASTPFFTTKIQGSGIGLSITESFVKAAGGALKWENRPEGGARVYIDLPEAKVSESHPVEGTP